MSGRSIPPPPKYTVADLVDALKLAGVASGDLVLIHSELFALGPMANAATSEIPAIVYGVIRDVIGPTGTLAVPAAFEDYARLGTPYDCRRSPVDRAQGALGAYVAALPDAVRTYCPLSAIAAVGPLARDVCHTWTGSAYGTGSAWEKLHEHDATFCFLGVPPTRGLTFVMYIQFRFGVPYLYNKLYAVPIYEDGEIVPLPVTCAVRYLNPVFKISIDVQPFEDELRRRGLVGTATVGRGAVAALTSARTVFAIGTEMLRSNLYYFCRQQPEFIPGQIPTDGNTGPFVPDRIRLSIP